MKQEHVRGLHRQMSQHFNYWLLVPVAAAVLALAAVVAEVESFLKVAKLFLNQQLSLLVRVVQVVSAVTATPQTMERLVAEVHWFLVQ
jgi:hypothetical protein